MNADSIKIECEEDGFWLVVTPGVEMDRANRFRITDPEALYDHVRAAIGPWLRERDEARLSSSGRDWPITIGPSPYDLSDPKHPDFHSIHADLTDLLEGK